jgi:hypothetical protein
MSDIALFFGLAVTVTALRLLLDLLLAVLRSRSTEETRPYTTAEIAEEGRMRAAQTDVSYIYYNRQVRKYRRSQQP